jgi:hypothetical protein
LVNLALKRAVEGAVYEVQTLELGREDDRAVATLIGAFLEFFADTGAHSRPNRATLESIAQSPIRGTDED